MSPRLSNYLDLVRFLAAIIVLLSHFAYERFSNGTYLFIRDWNLGSDAVVVFFVLSGFVIAFVTDTKDKTASTYFFNRGTRLLSVIAPALLLTFLLDRTGAFLSPENYSGWWYNPLPPLEFFFKGLTFSNEWTGLQTRLGTNGPLWSISYEAAYYILFGLFYFTKSISRIIFISTSLIFFGLNILLLAPSWILGALLYKLIASETRDEISKAISWLSCLSPVVLYIMFLTLDLPQNLDNITHYLLGNFSNSLRFSDEFIWNALIGILFSIHLYGISQLMRKSYSPLPYANKTKWLAGATFSIYIIHYPALQFFKGVLPNFSNNIINDITLLSMTLIVCFIFAHFFERRLYIFRKWCRDISTAVKLKTQSF